MRGDSAEYRCEAHSTRPFVVASRVGRLRFGAESEHRWKRMRTRVFGMKTLLRIALGLWIAAGCHHPAPYIKIGGYDPMEPTGRASEAQRGCIEAAASRAYLETVHARLVEVWDRGFGIRFRQVISRVSLDSDGNVEDVFIVQSPSNRLSGLATSVIENAAPFDAMPSGARCLADHPLTIVFRVDRR